MKNLVKYFFVILVAVLITTTFTEAKKKEEKKNCTYCIKYEKMKDWPESERPAAFIWEDIKYPEGMFLPTSDTPKKKQGEAGGKVYARFVKGKGSLNKYQHLMIRDMAYFEALYNEMLADKKASVETVEGLKKGREAMRMSLQISPKAKASEAVIKFWATGKMLKKAWK